MRIDFTLCGYIYRAATDAGGKSSTSRSSSGAVLQSDGNAALNIRTNLGSTTIVGFMATRRLAKNLLTRFRQDKRPVSHQTIMLPTYQLEPTKLFESWKVQQILKAILDARMRTFRYSPRTAAMLSKILTSECKDEVKKLEFARYKIICVVTLGEKRDQSVGLSSLCVWNTDTDNMASYSWENSQCFCNVTVYGIYHD